MVHVALLGLVVDAVQLLLVVHRAEGCNREHLRLAAGKQAAAVYAVDEADLCCQRADLVEASAVHALAVFEQPAADNLLLHLVDQLAHDGGDVGVLLGEVLDDRVLDRHHARVAHVFVVGVERGHEVLLAEGEDLVKHIVIQLAGGVGELRLADLGNDAIDKAEQALDLLMREHDGVVHVVVRDFLCARLDHDDLLHRGGNGQLQRALVALRLGGVDDRLAVHHTDEDAADRAVPRNIRDGERDGCADHAGDLMRAVGIDCHDGQRDGHVVAQILREQGADRAVDDARGQNGLFAGTALTAQEAAGDLARRVHSLLKIDGEGQEVDAVAGLFRRGGAGQHDGLAVADEAGAVGKAGELAGLDHKRSACEGVLEDLVVFKHLHILQKIFFRRTVGLALKYAARLCRAACLIANPAAVVYKGVDTIKPPLCKGRCRRTAAEGLLQSHGTTPQALTRQLTPCTGGACRTPA